MRVHTVVLALAALAAAPAFAAKPQIQWDEAYDFSTIKTFQWDPNPDSQLQTTNPFMHSRVVAAIEYELTASGLTEVQANPDVYVTYHTSTEKQVRLESDSYGYGFGGYGGAGWGHYGYGYGYAGPVSTTTRVVEYDEGTLVVDIWAAANKQLIWRGSASRVFSEDVDKAESQVVKIIKDMAAQSKKLRARAAKDAANK
jgi:Domain of unknown function (DUF4136)